MLCKRMVEVAAQVNNIIRGAPRYFRQWKGDVILRYLRTTSRLRDFSYLEMHHANRFALARSWHQNGYRYFKLPIIPSANNTLSKVTIISY